MGAQVRLYVCRCMAVRITPIYFDIARYFFCFVKIIYYSIILSVHMRDAFHGSTTYAYFVQYLPLRADTLHLCFNNIQYILYL